MTGAGGILSSIRGATRRPSRRARNRSLPRRGACARRTRLRPAQRRRHSRRRRHRPGTARLDHRYVHGRHWRSRPRQRVSLQLLGGLQFGPGRLSRDPAARRQTVQPGTHPARIAQSPPMLQYQGGISTSPTPATGGWPLTRLPQASGSPLPRAFSRPRRIGRGVWSDCGLLPSGSS